MIDFFLNIIHRGGVYYSRYRKNQKFNQLLNNQNSLILNNNSIKNVLICMHSLDWGGAERFAIECIEYLHNKGIKYHIFVEKKCDNVGDFLSFVNLNQITFANNYQKSEEQLLQLASVVNPSILHIHHSWSAYKALPSIARSVYVVDSLHIIEYQSGGYPYLSAKNHRYIQLHHATNQGLMDFMHIQLGIPNYRLRLGYLIDRSLNLQSKNRNFQPSSFVIGFLGRFEKQKRPELFIECADYIIKKNTKLSTIKFVMQGEGSLKGKCMALVNQKKMTNRFIFRDPSENIDDFHESVDILLNVSENEGLALTALESAKKRTLYIGTDVGQQNEIVAKECLVSANPVKIKKEVLRIINKVQSDHSFFDNALREQVENFDGFRDCSAKKMILEWIYG
jgi:glycosyltransferase involved in cell wall biosynthesis